MWPSRLKFLRGSVELIFGVVWILACLGPTVEVGDYDWLIVHCDSDLPLSRGDDEVVPAILVRRLPGRSEGVVEGPAAVLIRPRRRLDLNL